MRNTPGAAREQGGVEEGRKPKTQEQNWKEWIKQSSVT